jgi:hypothetical protein
MLSCVFGHEISASELYWLVRGGGGHRPEVVEEPYAVQGDPDLVDEPDE